MCVGGGSSMENNNGQFFKRSIYLQSIYLIPVVVSELYPRQCTKNKNEQRATTPKLDKAE